MATSGPGISPSVTYQSQQVIALCRDIGLRSFAGIIKKENGDYAQVLGQNGKRLEDQREEHCPSMPSILRHHFKARENPCLAHLVHSGNQVLNKYVITLQMYCDECDSLVEQAETRFFDGLLLYGTGAGDGTGKGIEREEGGEEGDEILGVAQLLPLLQDVAMFGERVKTVVAGLCGQLERVYETSGSSTGMGKQGVDCSEVHLGCVFRKMGKLLCCVVTLDEILSANRTIHDHWARLDEMCLQVEHNPDFLDGGADEADRIGKCRVVVNSITHSVLGGQSSIFHRLLGFPLSTQGYTSGVSGDNFASHFRSAIVNLQIELEDRIGTANETDQQKQVVALCALYVLYTRACSPDVGGDKKLFRNIYQLYRKVPVVQLYGNIVIGCGEFLLHHLPSMVKVLGRKEIDLQLHRSKTLETLHGGLIEKIREWKVLVGTWRMRLLSPFVYKGCTKASLNSRVSLIVRGLVLAYSIHNTLKAVLSLHVYCSIPITKLNVLCIAQLMILSKSIEEAFYKHAVSLSAYLHLVVELVVSDLVSLLDPIKKKIVAGGGCSNANGIFSSLRKRNNKNYNEQQLDILGGLQIALDNICAPLTSQRMNLCEIALSVVNQPSATILFDIANPSSRGPVLSDENRSFVFNQLYRLDILCNLSEYIKQACDCSFVYFYKEVVFPIYFQNLFVNPRDANQISYVLAVARDAVDSLTRANASCGPNAMIPTIDNYERFILRSIQTQILDPLCLHCENDLRVAAHSNPSTRPANIPNTGSVHPFSKGTVGSKSDFFHIPPFLVIHRYLCTHTYVSNYLDETFYNLSTVAMYDCKTYQTMRNLAAFKFGLNSLMEVYLPEQTPDQGIDVLEIMRKIHVFVARYNYNLNNQVFVEKYSLTGKYLNTINIRNIAGSIRTHGIGIMNTTVNYIYQFLQRKLFLFSQFLFDDHIKSRLMKDNKVLKSEGAGRKKQYPYEFASRFNKSIRALGLTEDGLSFLDQFRILITQIGNAMGYIRMVRSSGLRYLSTATRVIPDFDKPAKFQDLRKEPDKDAKDSKPNPESNCGSNSLPPQSHIYSNFDTVVDDMCKSFAEGADYFKLLIEVFRPEFVSDKNKHLTLFYLIIPPLTLNYVEYMLSMKEKISRKNKREGDSELCFSDDGFAMGVAFLLQVLKQVGHFDSTHWFQSVHEYYEPADDGQDSRVLFSRIPSESGNPVLRDGKLDDGSMSAEKFQQTAKLTSKRLELYRREFELLYYSLSSAKIFFR